MDTQEITTAHTHNAPSLMPWQAFAEWIHMGDEPQVVRGWLDRGYIPSIRVGKRLMVNVKLLEQQLLEEGN